MDTLSNSEGAVNSKGWVKVPRTLLEHPRFKDGDWLKVWLFLLLNATHQRRRALFNSEMIELRPGQLVTTRAQLVSATGVERNKLERILRRLESEHEIEQRSSPVNRLISLVRWREDSASEQPNEQRVSNARAALLKSEQVTSLAGFDNSLVAGRSVPKLTTMGE